MRPSKFPDSVDGLLAALEQMFPEVNPEPGEDRETVMFKAGQRSVPLMLREWRKNANNPPPAPRPRGRGRSTRD